MPLTYFDPIEDTSEDPEFLAQDIVEDEEDEDKDEEEEIVVDDDDSVDDLDPDEDKPIGPE